MKHFIQTEFFRQLREDFQDNLPNNLDKLYEKFASKLFAERNKLSLTHYHKALCYAKVEFACLQNQGEMKKKTNGTAIY